MSERKRREINVKEKKMVGINEGLTAEKWEERESDREEEKEMR